MGDELGKHCEADDASGIGCVSGKEGIVKIVLMWFEVVVEFMFNC
jgi:hypothetical protein